MIRVLCVCTWGSGGGGDSSLWQNRRSVRRWGVVFCQRRLFQCLGWGKFIMQSHFRSPHQMLAMVSSLMCHPRTAAAQKRSLHGASQLRGGVSHLQSSEGGIERGLIDTSFHIIPLIPLRSHSTRDIIFNNPCASHFTCSYC